MIDKEKPEFEVALFEGQNFQSLAQLAQTTYKGREISSSQYLSWEYAGNPDGNAVISIARRVNEIVGQYIVLPRNFILNGEIINGSLSVNTLTHPRFRGSGLFPLLAENSFNSCREKGIHFTVGFPNNKSAPVISRKKIFETAGNLPLLIKFINPVKSALQFLSSRKNKTGSEIQIEIPFSDDKCSVFNFQNHGDKLDELIFKFNQQKKITTNRSRVFLKWRYEDIPQRKYIFIKEEVNNSLSTLVIFRSRYIFGMRCGIIADLINDKNHKPDNILKFIHEIAALNRLDLIFVTAPDDSSESISLKQSGFISIPQFILPQQLPFIVRMHSDVCPPEIADFKNWYLTFGDYDVF